MEELKKINRMIDREYPEAYRETLVVLDGTTGQNALSQAREFKEAANITGIILTKAGWYVKRRDCCCHTGRARNSGQIYRYWGNR